MNEIRTLNIDEACQLLHTHKSTLYQKIASGEIPAARIGRSWIFVELDLVDYIRKQYKAESQEVRCHSTNRKAPIAGMSTSRSQAVAEFDSLLARKTKSKRRNTTTS